MSDSFHLRTGLSCLPFIGPLVAVYNIRDTEEVALRQMNPWVGRKAEAIFEQCQASHSFIAEARISSLRTTLKRGRVYALSGAIGAALTIAATIKLLAFKIFLMAAISAPYLFIAAWCLFKIGQYNWHIREYQDQKVQSAINEKWPEKASVQL